MIWVEGDFKGEIWRYKVSARQQQYTVVLQLFKVPLHPNHVFFVFNMFLELIYENHGGIFHLTLLWRILEIFKVKIISFHPPLVVKKCHWRDFVAQWSDVMCLKTWWPNHKRLKRHTHSCVCMPKVSLWLVNPQECHSQETVLTYDMTYEDIRDMAHSHIHERLS